MENRFFYIVIMLHSHWQVESRWEEFMHSLQIHAEAVKHSHITPCNLIPLAQLLWHDHIAKKHRRGCELPTAELYGTPLKQNMVLLITASDWLQTNNSMVWSTNRLKYWPGKLFCWYLAILSCQWLILIYLSRYCAKQTLTIVRLTAVSMPVPITAPWCPQLYTVLPNYITARESIEICIFLQSRIYSL